MDIIEFIFINIVRVDWLETLYVYIFSDMIVLLIVNTFYNETNPEILTQHIIFFIFFNFNSDFSTCAIVKVFRNNR